MASNQTVEAPNFEKISKEAGQFTSDAINLLWAAINDTRAVGRRNDRRSQETLAPLLLTVSAAATVSDLDLGGASMVSFIGASAQNFTGMKAPQTGEARLVFLQVSGAGTITFKNTVTSETANQLATKTGADIAGATGYGAVYGYLASKWRQIV